MALFFCQAEGKTQGASASRTVPPRPGKLEGVSQVELAVQGN